MLYKLLLEQDHATLSHSGGRVASWSVRKVMRGQFATFDLVDRNTGETRLSLSSKEQAERLILLRFPQIKPGNLTIVWPTA